MNKCKKEIDVQAVEMVRASDFFVGQMEKMGFNEYGSNRWFAVLMVEYIIEEDTKVKTPIKSKSFMTDNTIVIEQAIFEGSNENLLGFQFKVESVDASEIDHEIMMSLFAA